MSTSAPAPHSPPSPQVVGNAFVEQYYNVLHESPESVYKFYQESSILSRPNSDGVMISVTTTSAINDMILGFDFKNYIAQIMTVDSQPSYNEGVFVLVTGCLIGHDKIRQNFTQSFFLAPHGKGIYFVLNDMFRFVTDNHLEELNQVADNVSIDIALEASPSLERELVLEQDQKIMTDADPPPEVVTDQVEEAYCPPENEHPVAEKEASIDPPAHPIDAQPVPEATPPITQVDNLKKSYASIVNTKGKPAPVHVHSTKINPSLVKPTEPTSTSKTPVASSAIPAASSTTPVASSAIPVAASTRPVASSRIPAADTAPTTTTTPSTTSTVPSTMSSVASNTAAPETETPPTSSNADFEKSKSLDSEGYSVFVRGLPMNSTAEQVEEEFKRFGPIKPGGVQVRHHKMDNFCFGFVEFESPNSMQAAIKASPIVMGSHKAFVDEKRTKTRVINGVVTNGSYGGGRGRYPMMARGGFQNDNFRGQGGYGGNARSDFRGEGGYGGNARSDFKGRGEYPVRGRGPPGRNDFYSPWGHQNNGYPRASRPMGMKPSTTAT